MHYINIRSLKSLVVLLLTLFTISVVNAADLKKGANLFKANCATCHNKNMTDKLTGPPMKTGLEEWAAYPEKDLYDWIRNSQALIEKGHPQAIKIWNEYKPVVMTPFPNLKDEEIADILAYVHGVIDGTYPPKEVAAAPAGGAATKEASNNNWIYVGIFGLLALLALILAGISRNLKAIENEKNGEPVEKKSLVQLLTSKSVIGVVLFALIVLGSFTTVNNAIQLGRQQNYAPDQPIKFSHVTHAGINKIDCQFCHDGARRSKHSVIPSANTCMNCHKAIKKGSEYGTQEITKIFASIGFDPNEDKYIENYDKLSQKDVAKIYKKWIRNQYLTNEGASMDATGKEFVDDQWNHIVSSLTNEHKKKVQGPIEWIRVHNLPDHVYFNHSQHVTVGKLDCEACHGKVAEMKTLRQYAPLSMGWCITCHKETKVQFNENPYYDSYVRYHQELKDGKRDKVTVADVGGLECQKCHY
jgi:mono/diheme cytochrome c family protein